MAKYFDETKLVNEYGGDFEILSEVYNVMQSDSPERFIKLQDAIKNLDFKEIELQAHTLKGSFKIFYATDLVEVMFKLETAGRNQTADNSAELIKKANELYSFFAAELNEFIQSSIKVA